MTKIIISLVLLLVSLTLTAQENNTNGVSISVSINKIPTDKGVVRFALYAKKGFLEKPVLRKIGKIKDGKTEITFKNVPNNTYSIVCYHDVNENNIIDFSPNGMPTEDIGVTNSYVRFGPPNFEDTKFTVLDKPLHFEIKF